MRPAHVTSDGCVLCSVKGCGELLGVIIDHPLFDGQMFEFAPHMIWDDAEQLWRPTRRYTRTGIPFRRRLRMWRVPDAAGRLQTGYNPAADTSRINVHVRLPQRAQQTQPLPALARCRHGHESLLDPTRLPIDVWIGHDGTVSIRS
jgi:hypothetical protein